jgi:hypothetical protein
VNLIAQDDVTRFLQEMSNLPLSVGGTTTSCTGSRAVHSHHFGLEMGSQSIT